MLPPSSTRPLLLAACAIAVAAAVAPLAERVLERRFGDPRWLKLEAAMEGEEEEEARERGGEAKRRFDQPDEALAFYANSRTGPIVTDGPNATTGVRPIDTSAYLPALRHMRAMPRYSSAAGAPLPSYDQAPGVGAAAPGAALTTWTNLGPSNQGGRTRALLIDPGNPNVMYAGGVAGGVWKSTDAGANWTAMAQLQMPNLAVVSLAFDPTTSSTIYAGTGEGVFNADAIRGAGIFKSTDAGVTWTQLAGTANSNFYYVNSLIVSPRNAQRLWAATRTGLFRSIDGGASWTQLVSGSGVNGCTQVAMQLTGATGFVFGACGNFAQGTVYRADDSNASTFSSVLSNVGMGRSSIAVAPSNPAVVYVMSASTTSGGPGADGLHAVYRSTSNGDLGSFTTQVDAKAGAISEQQKINQLLLSNPLYGLLADCGLGSTQYFNQGWYDNVLAVDPLDENRVWAGGVDLFRSDDGGANWGVASYWWFSKGVDPEYHHADQHGLVFHPNYNGTTNKILFSTSDGGVERVDDARAVLGNTVAAVCGTPVATSPTWVDRNNGYITTQFYDGTVYPDGATFFGGLQDNGTQRGATAGLAWSTLRGGDGGYVAVNTLGDAVASNDVLFLENTGLSIQRSTNGGSSFSTITSGITNSGFLFITPFTMNQGNKQQLWIGGRALWRTINQGTSWTQASTNIGGGSVSAIAVHPLDGDRVLAGTSIGQIAVSTTALSTTSATTWTTTSPTSSYVSWLAWDPNDVNVAYATVSAFGVTNLFKSTNGGATWTASVGSGGTALPQIPALSVVVNPGDSQQVFVGTDLGVFTSIDGGASWYLENSGFANTPVEALKFNETAPYQLYAFTHGRGAWRVALNTSSPTAPIATADSYVTAFNTPLTVTAPGVLANDNANGGGAMTAVLDSTTVNGTLALNGNGSFTFTPTTGFSGNTSFTYHASNGNGSSSVVSVTIMVNADAPTTANDSYSASINTALTVTAPGVLANDATNGGGTMTTLLVSTVAHGSLTLNSNGSFTYTPTAAYTGPDSFTYRAVNGVGNGNVATVSLTVNALVPTTVADSYSTAFNTALNVAAPGVLGNDSSNGGGSMSAVLVVGVAHGTLTLYANGSFTYTPTSGYAGPDSFTYRATNGIGNGNIVTVSLTVNAGAPTTVAEAYNTPFNTTLSVAAPGVLANDSTNGGGTMSTQLVTGPAHGNLTLNGNGSLSFTPTAGYNGPDSFTYRAVNSVGPGNTVTVSLTVGVAAPTSLADSYSTPFNTPLSVTAPGVLSNDNTNGGGAMTAAVVTNVTHGTLSLSANGAFVYTPIAGYAGPDSFTYRATNGSGAGNVATVSITVNAGVPTTVADSYSTPFNTALNIAAPGVLANDSANGAAMTASLVGTAAHGTLALNASGGFTYTPTTGYSGADSFTYRATNSAGPGNTVTVSLTVDAAPVGPQAPSNFRITGMSGNTVSMAWTLPTTGPAVIALQLEGGLTPGSVLGALPLGPTPGVTVALPTGSFFIRMRTITAGGTSGPSNEIVANINVPVAPSAPSNLLGMVNGSELALAWTPTFGGGAPSGAILDVSGPVSASLPLGNVETFTYPAVPPGTYTFSVRQTNATAASAGSNAVTLTFPGACTGAPQTPRNFAAFNAGGVLNVIWDPPASGPAPTAYTLTVGGSFVGAFPMASRSFVVPGVPPGTYTFSVTAANSCGGSAPTATQVVSFP